MVTGAIMPSLKNASLVSVRASGISVLIITLTGFYTRNTYAEAGADYLNGDVGWSTLREKLADVIDLGDEVFGTCIPADIAPMRAVAHANGRRPITDGAGGKLSDPQRCPMMNRGDTLSWVRTLDSGPELTCADATSSAHQRMTSRSSVTFSDAPDRCVSPLWPALPQLAAPSHMPIEQDEFPAEVL